MLFWKKILNNRVKPKACEYLFILISITKSYSWTSMQNIVEKVIIEIHFNAVEKSKFVLHNKNMVAV